MKIYSPRKGQSFTIESTFLLIHTRPYLEKKFARIKGDFFECVVDIKNIYCQHWSISTYVYVYICLLLRVRELFTLPVVDFIVRYQLNGYFLYFTISLKTYTSFNSLISPSMRLKYPYYHHDGRLHNGLLPIKIKEKLIFPMNIFIYTYLLRMY